MQYKEELIGLVTLSFCSALVGLFFSKGSDFKQGLKTMVGGFLFGTVISYIIYDNQMSLWIKKIVSFIGALFARPIYDKISNRIGYWLDRFVSSKIEKSSGIESKNKELNNKEDDGEQVVN